LSDSFDCVIRGGTVVTASDSARCDVGIRNGRAAALAETLRGAGQEIDADGLLVMPGGVDAHCHYTQPSYGGAVCADDFESATLSVLCGGTTTTLSFATQFPGEPLRETVATYRASAEGKAMNDYGIHLILIDPTPQVLGQDLPALIRNGYT
tara:strand:- start:6123 stop:6578 length:456 start_codon:yes stop_codon:yes gene_type:complete